MRFFNPDPEALTLQRINLAAASLAVADLLTNPQNAMKKSVDIIIHLLTVNAFRPDASVWEMNAVATLNLIFTGKIAVDLHTTLAPKNGDKTSIAQEMGVGFVDGGIHMLNHISLISKANACLNSTRTAKPEERLSHTPR